jgi:hypothetical protein
VDSNIIYNLDFVVKDMKNYDFPCKFSSLQFVEIEPGCKDLKPAKLVHYDQIKNIIFSMNNKDLNIPYKYSTIGKLISKNFKEEATRIVLGDFKESGNSIEQTLKRLHKFVDVFKQFKPEHLQLRIKSNKAFKGFSMSSISRKKM